MSDGLTVLFLVCFGVGSVMIVRSLLTGLGYTPVHIGHVHVHALGHGRKRISCRPMARRRPR
jgi:hypothetical protein